MALLTKTNGHHERKRDKKMQIRTDACLVRVKRNKKGHKMIHSVIFSRLPGQTKVGQMCI